MEVGASSRRSVAGLHPAALQPGAEGDEQEPQDEEAGEHEECGDPDEGLPTKPCMAAAARPRMSTPGDGGQRCAEDADAVGDTGACFMRLC